MRLKRYLTAIIVLLASVIIVSGSAYARDWDDLHEEDEKVFGSEKELKYNPDMFFLQRESWENHYSFMLFWLFKYTDYPKYSSVRFLPFYYGLESRLDNRRLSFIPVILTYWETDLDEKFRINPLFVSGSSSSGNMEDNYSYSWIHGYSYYKNGSMDLPERSWWFPIIPLVYRSTDSYGGHMNIAWLLDYSWRRDKSGEESLDRFWFIPFLFHEPGDNGYTHALPPIFLYNRHSNGEYWVSLFPLFKRSKDINYTYSGGTQGVEYEDSFKSLLYCYNNVYKAKWRGEKKSSEFWFPVIPLFYSYNEPGVESHRNLLWLIDWHNNAEGKTDRFWFIPMVFHEPGENGFTLVAPLYFHNRHENGEYWLGLLPFFKRSKDINYTYSGGKQGYEYEDSFKSPLYCYNNVYTDKWKGDIKISEFWFPIIPLVYSYNEPGVESHRNILWIIDWHNDKEGNTDRFWFAPFYFRGGDSYRHILPPVYMSFRESEDDSYSHLFPFYMNSRYISSAYDSKSGKYIQMKERLLLTPLSGYSKAEGVEGKSDADSNALWFPIIPLYYHSEWSEGSHTNILWAFDWGRDSEGKMERFWFIPFIFHEQGEGGYRMYIPFFFRPSGWTEEKGVTYSPFYYHRWSPEEEVKWSWLIHYKRSNSQTGEYLNTWIIPFYYHHKVPEQSETTWVTPLYYHHDSLEHKGYFARVVAPLYWNFETDKRDTTLFLPLYFDTNDKKGKNSFYVNIIGLSRSVTSGVNPVIDADLGFNKKGLYIDTDLSWLVDVWSLSTRVTIPLKKGEDVPEEITGDNSDVGKVVLSKKSGVSRESSINFWGTHFMFGLVAYERADTKRHFRLLPLSWITWDEKSENRLKWIVNYLSFKEEETEYLVFFPFYGYQREGESYSTGYLLNAYWHEYDHEKGMHEYTLLWPFINWYNSPEKDGWRVAPLVWHKNIREKDTLYSSTYTPLYMNRSRRSLADDTPLYRLNLSPFHFYRYSKEKDETSKLWFSTIPLVFYKKNETTGKYLETAEGEGLIKAGAKSNFPSKTAKYSEYTSSDTLKWLFPLYMVSESETEDRGKNLTTTDYTLIGLPLLYYNSTIEKSGDPHMPEKKSGTLFAMGYYNEFSSDSTSSSILFGLYSSEKYPGTKDYSYGLLYGLFNVSEREGTYENYFRPFYYYGNDNGKSEHSALMGLYRKKYDPATGDSGFSLLYGIFSRSLYHYTVDPVKKNIPLVTWETWLIPAFYMNNTGSSDSAKPWKDNLSLSILHYRHDVDEPDEKSYTFWAPILPLYYHSADSSGSHTNFFWLMDYGKDENDNISRFWVMPVYFSKPGDRGYFHIAPLYFSSWDRPENDNTYIICGLYLHNMPGYNRQNFLYLYDHRGYENSDYDEYSFLFTTVDLEIHPDIKNMRVLWGLLADTEWTKNSYDIEGLLWLAAIEKDGGYFHSRVLPIWYYESTENTHTLVIPPALTWDSRDSDESRFQLWALGALWYRDYEPAEKSDLQAALLGTLYYKLQREERGYESRGSLWGLLWEYETESETGFSKFSLFKFIYKRIEMDGDVQHRVLGITF